MWYIVSPTMPKDIITRYRSWFTSYCGSFVAESDGDRKNYLLKESHTYAVCDNALLIAQGLGLDEKETALAASVALFHDAGRFPQYRDFRTFRDSVSKNHAALGAKVLLEQRVLGGLPKEDRDLVVRAVMLHNVFSLPQGLPERTLLHSRIIRDADKLDIWRVFIDLLALPEAERPSAAALGLADTPGHAPEILLDLEQRRMVRLTRLRSLNDFKLLQLGWVYDLNFLPSLRLLRERDMITHLAATLPRTGDILSAVDAVRHYVDERLAEDREGSGE